VATRALLAVTEPAESARARLDAHFAAGRDKTLLRILTCGSVDDGKSTLIGRLLYDSRALPDDQLATLRGGGKRGDLDFASLVDGLSAEREQGITIDVAYRFFATPTRKFIVADTPGHERYTRNMVTGASTADLAIVLVDATKGVLRQTRRHSFLVHLLGIERVVLAVNKMDLVGFDQAPFDAIVAEYAAFAREVGIASFTAIPMSGRGGDNVTHSSANMPWYGGPTLMEHLESVPALAAASIQPFRMPVQWVNRPDANFRGYAGTVASGSVRAGDRVTVLPSGEDARVDRIVTFDGDRDEAHAGQAVTLTLTRDVDCSRGDTIAVLGPGESLPLVDGFDATVVWMASEPLVPGRAYWLKTATQTVSASVAQVIDAIDVDTGRPAPATALELNEIGRCEIVLDRLVAVQDYAQNRTLGGFILIDRASNATVAAGMIVAAAAAGSEEHEAGDAGRVLWLTGASVAERLSFAHRARQRLIARGRTAVILDPASLVAGLNADLGTSAPDLAEAGRRMREVAALMSRAGLIVLAAWDGAETPGPAFDITGADAGDWVI